MKTVRLAVLAVLTVTLGACAGTIGGLGDFFAGALNPGKANPGNFWSLEDAIACTAGETYMESDAPSVMVDPGGEPRCLIEVATNVVGCLADPVSGPSPRLTIVFPIKSSGANRQVLYEICKNTIAGSRFPHLDGHVEGGALMVDDANRGGVQ